MNTSSTASAARWRLAGVIEAARQRYRRRRRLMLLAVLAMALIGLGIVARPGPQHSASSAHVGAPGLLPPPRLAANKTWYVRSVGTLTSPLVAGPSTGRVRRLVFENLVLPGGTELTRWTPVGRRAPAQTGASQWGLGPILANDKSTPDTPQALIRLIHTVRVWRNPSQTFAVIVDLLTGPAPTALHLAGIDALPMVPGIHVRSGADWLGRHGRVYVLGNQSVVIKPATGGVLGVSGPVLTEAFTEDRLAPRCVRYGASLHSISGPRWCFVLPKPPSPRRLALIRKAEDHGIRGK